MNKPAANQIPQPKMTVTKGGRTFHAKCTAGRYFYFSPLNGRWLPVAAAEVTTHY